MTYRYKSGIIENNSTMSIEIWHKGKIVGQCGYEAPQIVRSQFFRRFLRGAYANNKMFTLR